MNVVEKVPVSVSNTTRAKDQYPLLILPAVTRRDPVRSSA